MVVATLLNELPSNLRYQRVPLPDEFNAFEPWARVVECFREIEAPSDAISAILYGWPVWETPPTPADDDWERLTEWTDANQQTINLLDEGLSRGRLQLPAYVWTVLKPPQLNNLILALRDCGMLVRARQRLALHRGDANLAVEDAVRLLKLSDLVLRGEGSFVHMVIGSSLQRDGLKGAREVAQYGELSDKTTRELRESVAGLLAIRTAIESAILVDLGEYNLSFLAAMPETNDAQRMVESLNVIQSGWSDDDTLELDDPAIRQAVLEERRAESRRQRVLLLEGHPQPFDRRATVQLLGKCTAASLHSLGQVEAPSPGWIPRLAVHWRRRWRPTFEDQLQRAWPCTLRPDFPLELFGNDAHASARRTYCAMPRSVAAAWKMRSDRQLRRCRDRLHRIDNPVGRIIAETLRPTTFPATVLHDWQNELASTRQSLRLS